MAKEIEWTPKEVRVDEIEVDARLQPRHDIPDSTEYAEIIAKNRKAWVFPPLKCVRVKEGREETLYLVSGFTRLKAAKEGNRTHVPIEVRDGKWKDAVSEACGSNHDNGFHRTPADKRKAVLLFIREVSDKPATVARACKVSRALVYRVLHDGEDLSNGNGQSDSDADLDTKSASGGGVSDAPEVDPQSELGEMCQVCGMVNWELRDDGCYHCRSCHHVHGEASALDEDDEDPPSPLEESMVDGVTGDLKAVKAAYGALQRAMKKTPLYEKCERQMLRIHKEIEDSLTR